ncbi:MAG: penicillin acylase family protein [Candidatus Competibacteraceae bacterium]|jgi:penicillin amidase|nr:penicillin acylase family protein [Candidatus Competibacteraceae bacterium]
MNNRKLTLHFILRWVLILTSGLLILGIAGGVWLYAQLHNSLPQLNGQLSLAGLSDRVTIQRDGLGIPTIHGTNRLDVAHATGFVHAQDRFFQMDLLRRVAAGELAEIVGIAALPKDRAARIHRFRTRAREVLPTFPETDQTLIARYTNGVNAGLSALAAPPFEYLLLRTTPQPWQPEDTLLVIYAMYLDLQGREAKRESFYGIMHDVLPAELFAFLAPPGTEWDAPLQGLVFSTPAPPGPEVLDLRRQPPTPLAENDQPFRHTDETVATGSNNWAVTGSETAHGSALLADDMHLGLSVPNIWYRVSLVYPADNGQERQITGATLPGAPAIVVGSNGHVAWGLTNSQGDWNDLVLLTSPMDDPETYLTPEGPRRFQQVQETIAVKDAADDILTIRETHWGPVYDTDHQGRLRALRWVAHDQEAVNLGLLRLETATTVDQAMTVAQQTGVPAQNFVVADADGHIGWTILGPIPRRFGHSGRTPQIWADGSRGWDGWLQPAEYPRIVDPLSGRLWTANARVVSSEWLAKIGYGGYRLGARAQQIRDALITMEGPDEQDMLALQLDDRALFLSRWQDLLLTVLTPETLDDNSSRRELRHYVENWGGRAAVDSVGYRLVRNFRGAVSNRVFTPLVVACIQADEHFNYDWIRQQEGPLWRLITEQPQNLLDSRYSDWQQLLLAGVDDVLEQQANEGSDLTTYTWGAHNTSRIDHPFSRFVPWLEAWLDMPDIALPGDINMPRVQTPTAGASQRMVVSPGREEQGIFHMPAGQSGHPLSPHYRDGHQAWVQGRPSAFLPGSPVNTLTLIPTPTEGRQTP